MILIAVTCSPHRYRVDLITRLTNSERRSVFGVTTFNNRIFVVYRNLPFIVVYMSQGPYSRLANISIDGLKEPFDIAAHSSCLHVSDWASGAVWRVKTTESRVPVESWPRGVKVASISVTSDSEEKLVLLVAVDRAGSVKERNLTYRGDVHIYNQGIVMVDVVELSRDIIAPHCVVMTTRETFIVSYGYRWHGMNGVCEVDMRGRRLNVEFSSAPGGGVGQLNTPCHVALDDEERVIVADTVNNRVLLLNRQLMLQQVLMTWSRSDDAAGPVRLHYDRHSGRLLVGLYTGHLDIYQLRT